MTCSLLRYVGLVFILSFFISTGINQITQPAHMANALANSNLPMLLHAANINLTASQYVNVVQTTGILTLSFSLFILLGVGRPFFAMMLAILEAAMTVVMHLNLDEPRLMSEADLVHTLKNVAIIGALLFVVGSSRRSQRFSRARSSTDIEKKNQ